MLGAMIEVPSLLFQLDAFLTEVDFVSIGSNDLMQFLFAADRGHPRLAGRDRSAEPVGAAGAALRGRARPRPSTCQ